MDEALGRDTVIQIAASLRAALNSRSDAVRNMLRGSGTPGYNSSACLHSVPPVALPHGPILMRHLKEVNADWLIILHSIYVIYCVLYYQNILHIYSYITQAIVK